MQGKAWADLFDYIEIERFHNPRIRRTVELPGKT
mgnify:CR=1 FL=1